MLSKIKNLFWNLYAVVYDSLIWFQPYQELQDTVIKYLQLQKNDKVLDAGCGTGNLIKKILFSEPDLTIEAFDHSVSMIKIAKRKNPAVKQNITRLDLRESLPFTDKYFNKIACVNVLYAVERPGKTLEKLFQVLKENGVLVIVNPKKNAGLVTLFLNHLSRKGVFKTTLLFFPLFLLTIFNLFIIFFARLKHFHFSDEEQIESEAKKVGFLVEKIQPIYCNQAVLLFLRKP